MAKQTFSVGQVLTAAQMTSLQQTAMLGGSATAKTTSYTLVAADAGTVVSVNSTSATTITVNTGLFAAGDTVTIQNWGSGAVTITAGTATVNTAGSLIVPQYDGGVLYFTSASAAIYFDWVQAGATSPLTTKGDIWGYSTSDARIPIGANNTVLTADSTQSLGLKWATPSAGVKTLTSIASGNAPAASSFSITGLTQDYFMLRLTDLKWGTANGDILIRLNNDNTAKYTFLVVTTTTGDTYQYYGTGSLGSFWGVSTVANKRDANNHRVIEINNGGGSGYHPYTLRGYHANSGGSQVGVIGGGYYESTSPITSIQVIQADGYSFTSGSYELIGG